MDSNVRIDPVATLVLSNGRYDGTTLTKGSGKKVVSLCARCGRPAVKRYEAARKAPWCSVCAWALRRERKNKNSKVAVSELVALIDDAETSRVYGNNYIGSLLTPGSGEYVAYRCRDCNNIYHTVRNRLTGRCRGCSNRKRANELSTEAKILRGKKCRETMADKKHFPLGCLDEKRTLAVCGYRATSISPKSSLRVFYFCSICKQSRSSPRQSISDTPRCFSCTTHDPAVRRKINEGIRRSYAVKSESIIAKRRNSMLLLYGENAVFQKSYGKSSRELKETLEVVLGRRLIREKMLPSNKRIDIYDAVTQIGVEYNGLYWHHEHSPHPRLRNYHWNKWKEAASDGIRLITLFEDEWLLRRHAVEGVLKAAFGVYDVKIGARECALREISTKEAQTFMDFEHLQGGSKRALAAWGLFYRDGLEAAVTVARHQRQGHENVLVLDRLCFANGTHIQGGAGRLLKPLVSFVKAKGATKLVSWSDNRWSLGGVYRSLGFTAEELPPDYSYVNVAKPKERISKQSQKKAAVNCPSGLTEKQWAEQRGLSRIWDCGKVRWTLSLT
jgi:hypothetical protein